MKRRLLNLLTVLSPEGPAPSLANIAVHPAESAPTATEDAAGLAPSPSATSKQGRL